MKYDNSEKKKKRFRFKSDKFVIHVCLFDNWTTVSKNGDEEYYKVINQTRCRKKNQKSLNSSISSKYSRERESLSPPITFFF